MKLDFLIAGVNKCGSTTLTSLIEKHPDIFVSQSKDGSYVQEAGLLKKNGVYPGWETHKSSFYNQPTNKHPINKIVGEGNIWYSSKTLEENAAKFLLDSFPDIKLIFIVRDPIKRIESSFKEKHSSGSRWMIDCPYSIEKALKAFPDFIESSKYFARISHYLDLFPKKNCHILFLEDLKSDFTSTLNTCFDFLGVDHNNDIRSEIKNKSESKYFDTPELRAMRNTIKQPKTGMPLSKLNFELQDQFLVPLGYRKPISELDLSWSDNAIDFTIRSISEDIEKFSHLTERDLSIWKKYTEFSNRV